MQNTDNTIENLFDTPLHGQSDIHIEEIYSGDITAEMENTTELSNSVSQETNNIKDISVVEGPNSSIEVHFKLVVWIIYICVYTYVQIYIVYNY